MKKKIVSLLVLLAAAVSGAWADEVTIGDGTTSTYVTPYNSLWVYSYVQQVYTADEIGMAGTISSIAFCLSTNEDQTNEYDIFMKHVTRETFENPADFETVTAENLVYSGSITFSQGWTTITLDTPFEYDGTQNLMIAFHEKTPGYSTRYFYYTSKGNNSVLSFHSDGTNPDPYDIGKYTVNKYTSPNRANIKIEIGAAGGYALTTGENAHGTVSYTVGGKSVSKTTDGQTVTVTVTPDAGWSTKEVTARGYMPWGGASSRRQVPMTLLDEIPVSGSGNTWTFTMPTANALVNVTYKKELSNTDITISDITSPTYTGEELEPAIVVKDGTTTLEEGVDYTVSYTNNINAALATDATAPTVTITAVATSEKYSGSASKKFTILKADIPESDITAPTPKTLVYSQGTQTLINGGSAVGGTMQYSLNGSTYSTVLPSGNDAGTYTVYYRIVGDSNHNDVAPRTITVTIAQAVIDYMQLVKSVFIFNDETQIATVDVVKAGSLIVPESGYVVTGRSGYSVGIYTVTVTGVGNYAGSATAEFSIRKDLGSISYATTEVNKTYGNAPFTNKLTKSGDGQVTYSSDNTKVATVDADGQVTIVGVGTAVIKATVADGPVFGYATKEASYTLTVQAYKMNLHVVVADAWLYADKIAADYADIAAKLQAAVDAGYVVFYNDDATQVEVDAAQAEMEKALAKAKADVETATAIAGVKAAKADGEVWYDLQGRRVDSPVKGRVYILKGKKVVY